MITIDFFASSTHFKNRETQRSKIHCSLEIEIANQARACLVIKKAAQIGNDYFTKKNVFNKSRKRAAIKCFIFKSLNF